MDVQRILAKRPKYLTQEQREFYFDNGYLLLENCISNHWLTLFQEAIDRCVEESRTLSNSNSKIDIECDHSANSPRLRRLTMPSQHYEVFHDFALSGAVVDIAEDLVGPSVKFHHGKLNFKWSGGGEKVKWHQDIQYWPHTDFSPLTIGVYLCDVDDKMGPMSVIPGSHKGEIFDLYDAQRQWTGAIADKDLQRARLENAVYLKGSAGSVTVHNCCTVHGSSPNHSEKNRPLLLQTYSGGDSHPLLGIGTNGTKGFSGHQMVRGERPQWIKVDGRCIPVAPDWYQEGYTSIFDIQKSR